MAHDSFEDADVADVLNTYFVSVKVDREERPDVDAVYMDAVTAMTGHGGWPMTCLLTPDAKPFFAGTFFPKQQFLQLLAAAIEAWNTRRGEIEDSGRRIVEALTIKSKTDEGAELCDVETTLGAAADAAVRSLAEHYDRAAGGFGRAPKFPPSMVVEFLLRHHERTGEPTSLTMVAGTLRAMARGGMYDQLGGGFARYSVDGDWVVPHFEKMLYDNALLLRAYLHWHRLTEDPLAERIARETADFLLRDLRTPEGGFACALDADTEGVEGLTYVWTPAQLREVLGEDADWAAQMFEVTAAGTFEHGSSTLQLRADPDDVHRWGHVRSRLFDARGRRPQPGRDDKVITSWNGLAIGALAEAAVLLDEPRYLDAAVSAADLIVRRHLVDGRLRRTSRDGVAGTAEAVADDYGNLADGLLILHQASGDARWLGATRSLLDNAMTRFRAEDGGFYDTAADAETLIRRPRDSSDGATPAGASALIHALISYSALVGSLEERAAAVRALPRPGLLSEQARFFGWALAAVEALLAGPVEVAVVGEAGRGPLTATAWRRRPPGAVVISAATDEPGIALLADRPLVDGRPAAYVCRRMVCERPVTEVPGLLAALATA